MRIHPALPPLTAIWLSLSTPGFAAADRSGFRSEPAELFGPGTPCVQAHNAGVDAIAEYLDAEGDIRLRAGSWLGRDGRYLLPRPGSHIERIRFRALEDIAIEPSDVALAPCPDDFPVAAVESLSRAIDQRLGRYLGDRSGQSDLVADFQSAIAVLEASPYRHWLAVARFELASLLRATDQLEAAQEQYGGALSLFEAIDDPGGRAAAINSLGLVALRQGRLEAAADRFNEVQPLFIQLGDLHSVAAVDNNLGLLYMRRGQPGGAAVHLEMALSVLQGPVDLRSESPLPVQQTPADSPAELTWALNTLNNLAIVRRQQGSIDLAERYWRNVLALEGHASRAQTGAEARYNLGGLLLREARLDEALVLLSAAVDAFDGAQARRWMVETRVMLSQLYFRLGDLESALEFALAAIGLEPEDLNARLRAHRHLADLQQEAGDYEAAAATIDEAMALVEDRSSDPPFLMLASRRAHLQLLAGNIVDAIEHQRAVRASLSDLDWPSETARVAFRLALALMAADQASEAEALLMDALVVFRQTGEVLYELEALEALGRLYFDVPKAQLDASTRAFEQALELRHRPLSDKRRIGLSSTLARIDRRHIGLLAEQDRIEAAWQAAARIRNTDAIGLEQAHWRGRTQGERLALLAEHADLADELHHRRLSGEGSGAGIDLALKLDRVETRLRQLRHQSETGPALTLEDVQRRLAPGQLLLSYYLLPDGALLWAISREQVRLHELPGSSWIEATIGRLLARLRHPRQAPGAIEQLARELGDMLLAPARDMIDQARELIIEPHGLLHALPFAVLIDKDQVLVDRVSVQRVVSAGHTPRRPFTQSPENGRMLVVANPGWQEGHGSAGRLPRQSLVSQLLRDNALGRLPGTQREAELLASLAATGVDVRLKTGRAASRQFVLGGGLDGYSLVHLATHGLVDLHYPSLSALLLADENGPGATLLRPQEIAELRLAADLVVLSGCETGSGPIPAGEGALSLARPFLVAGARQVMSTLWKIDDQRTADFMQAFYRHLLAEDLAPAQALAAAQRDTWRDPATAHPFYWAGFTLSSLSLEP